MTLPPDVRISGHARDRYQERSKMPGVPIEQAWDEAVEIQIPVEWPYGPNGAFHPPSDTVLVWGPDDVRSSGYAVTTVLDFSKAARSYGSAPIHRLAQCDWCGLYYDPVEERYCPWCEEYGPQRLPDVDFDF